jgi:hypothetical protein
VTITVHPDHLLRTVNTEHDERTELAARRRLSAMLRRTRAPVPAVPDEREVALAA